MTMLGAPALAASGAIRAGAGLVRIAAPETILQSVVSLEPSSMGVSLAVDASGLLVPHETTASVDDLAYWADALVVGPGLGQSPGASAAMLRSIQQREAALVLDADGLNLLAALPEIHRDFHASAVLTPHPGEFARLAGALRISARIDDDASRARGAESMAQRLGCIVALKGAGTVVSDGLRTWVCGRGHPCMASGGTGDVLAGIIGAVIAQHWSEPRATPARGATLGLFECAQLGVEIHARAGEAWAHKSGADRGMAARDLLAEIPVVIGAMLANQLDELTGDHPKEKSP